MISLSYFLLTIVVFYINKAVSDFVVDSPEDFMDDSVNDLVPDTIDYSIADSNTDINTDSPDNIPDDSTADSPDDLDDSPGGSNPVIDYVDVYDNSRNDHYQSSCIAMILQPTRETRYLGKINFI